MITLKIAEQDFWKMVNALEDAAFNALHSAKELRTTSCYGAHEVSEKRMRRAHELFDIANELKSQAAECSPQARE